jgi:hypothetical protein
VYAGKARALSACPKNARDPNDFSRENSQLNSKNASPGNIISMDPSGLISPPTANSATKFFLFKDITTECNQAVFSKSQDKENVKSVPRFSTGISNRGVSL